MNEFIEKNGVLIYRIILCVLCWVGTIIISIIPSILISIEAADFSSLFNSLSYYTFQSNFLVLLWVTAAVIYDIIPRKREEKPFFLKSIVRGAITVYITFTFIVFAILLQPFATPTTDLLSNIRNILLHYLIPIMFIIDWIITEQEEKYEWKWEIYWLVYPLCYLLYTLIRGAIINWYPYYFFDVNRIGLPMVMVYSAALSGFFMFLIAVFIFSNRKLNARKNK